MKKFIALFSFFTFMFATTAFASVEHAEYGTEVEIPFAFNVGDREYAAGKYIVRLNRLQQGTAIMEIRDSKNKNIQIFLATRNNDVSGEGVELIFERVGEKRMLSRMSTPSGVFAVNRSQKSRKAPDKTVAASFGGLNPAF